MKLNFLYILMCVACLASCQTDMVEPNQGTGTLKLGMTRSGVASTYSIDEDLALKILDSNGDVYVEFRAGSVPDKLVLEPGTFTVVAYTENQDSWFTENNGRGAACYYGECEVSIEFDQIAYVNMQVPMTNYAVTLTLPNLFHDLFKEYTFNIVCGERSVNINENEKAYFAVSEKGFTYKLFATNTDNISHSTNPLTYSKVEKGKLYDITYYYGTDANSGGVDIEITDNMEIVDDHVPL